MVTELVGLPVAAVKHAAGEHAGPVAGVLRIWPNAGSETVFPVVGGQPCCGEVVGEGGAMVAEMESERPDVAEKIC
ncbi:MAG: hypothetical protein HW380_3621 [Magnetococcales bacterium]|nr:hypothetical protein [Magnetococcales bacterium]